MENELKRHWRVRYQQTRIPIHTHQQTATSQILLCQSPARGLTTLSSSVSAYSAPMNGERTEAGSMPTDPNAYTDLSADRHIPDPALLFSCSVTNHIEFIHFGMASVHEWRKNRRVIGVFDANRPEYLYRSISKPLHLISCSATLLLGD